jgi:hypothetical protein
MIAAIEAIAATLGVNKLLVWGALVVVALGVVFGIYKGIENHGADRVRAEVDRQNSRAGAAGGEARMSRGDCVDAGGVYHFDTGKCSGLAASDR